MQSYGAPKLEESQLWQFRDSWDKMLFGCEPRGEAHVYYKGEGVGFPQVQAVMSLVNSSLPVARPSTKSVPTMH
jgi:hypothetical protein